MSRLYHTCAKIYNMEMKPRRHKWGVVVIVCAVILAVLVVCSAIIMTRQLPEVGGDITYQPDETPLEITGLTQGQAAIGSEHEVKAVYGGDIQAPIASMAKVVTALVVLNSGVNLDQVIIIDEQDVAFYRQAVAVGGSRLQVVVGEQLTLQQMLEALMVVSANNMADSLVYHLFDTHENYQIRAGEWLDSHGLSNTVIGSDASGLDAGTMSTPSDMIKIGQLALEDSVLSQIVKIRKATYVLEGEVENTNELLEDGYFGINLSIYLSIFLSVCLSV